MVDDLKNMIESNIESYADNIKRRIGWMVRDIAVLEGMSKKLIKYNDWDDFIDVLNRLEIIQHDGSKCEEWIYRALEDCELLKRYNERCWNDE